jgi:uncharacterized membrane protein YhaH (DUF805 family)/RNA polymerase subunit RPABC4/transcription elongation factor Spt4
MSDVQQKNSDEIYCPSCGAIIKKEAEICPKCGVPKAKWRSSQEVFCASCGEKIKAEAEICPHCGVRQRSVSSGFIGRSDGIKNGLNYFVDVMKRYAVFFSGRARRAECWWFVLCVCIIQILSGIPGIITYFLFGSGNNFLANFVGLVLLVPSISVWWRRMHDVGKPGGYCFIPIYGLILALKSGDQGTNQYGPDPKEKLNV